MWVEPAVTVESVYVVTAPTEVNDAPSRNTSYPATATLSVDAVHVNLTDVDDCAVAARLVGTVGAVASTVHV